MRIQRVVVKNFRNLANIDLQLLPGTVIVGENRSGKSNLLYAIRLVLDASLSSQDRHLTQEDFWDGLHDGTDEWDPMVSGETIEVSLEISDFDKEAAVVAVLSDALIAEDPLVARLTYRFAPQHDHTSSDGRNVYRGRVVGGDRDIPIGSDLREAIYLSFLPALRDVESDIRNWRKSPLRRLLEAATKAVSESDLVDVRRAMKEANEKVNALETVCKLGESITNRVLAMVGESQAIETELAVAPDDPLRLIRNMRVFVDGSAHRALGSTSLGAHNVLYLALLELGLEARLAEHDIAHVVTAIEEPEAHLHPHLQRLVFGAILNDPSPSKTTLVTTHSPHIASVAPPQNLVVMRTCGNATSVSAAQSADLTAVEWADVGRYLDATRAELVFAQRVLFVEGYAEQVLLPAMAQSAGLNLDKAGITICAIHGTHFDTYIRFCRALGIPWAVITDGDYGNKAPHRGVDRASRLVSAIGEDGDPGQCGIFVGDTTFEYDIAKFGTNDRTCMQTLGGLKAGKNDLANDPLPRYEDFMKLIKGVGGKGRFAQRLATQPIEGPTYVAQAIEYLLKK